ncbi:hypothetical protein B9Z55_014974 [Caenorhabditis nigoni]|uniref:SUN domain-containing protein n=1 Tax=Caenorhabditis nigoni TaxID=1611254 RepID=A0A2G5U872_9PELO|nr:hypothetical protein B9Z55_014974 [Caenorhabditis nigoni]
MLPTTHRTNSIHKIDMEDPNTKTKMWYHWFNIRIRQYMILEIFFIISLIMILYKLQSISNQNDRVLEIVNSMQSQFGNMERKIESLTLLTKNQDISQFEKTEPLKQSIADALKNLKFRTQSYVKPVDSMQSQFGTMERKMESLILLTRNQGISQFEKTEPLKQSIADTLKNRTIPTQNSTEPIVQETKQSESETEESTPNVSIPKKRFLLNAADYVRGAFVNTDFSSSSSLKPIFRYDQTNLVILDRPQPPADKAWCTNDENPVLTIKLARYIKPISVSYQHSKWNGTIPNGTPRIYDVVGCLECDGKDWEPVVSDCVYSQYKPNEQEQICNISSPPDFPIRIVKFRFRGNYGNTNMTCVSLVRVYGETKTPVKIKEKNLKSEEICTDLRWYYHNNFLRYLWTEKNCDVLYKNDCCSECPECCQECLIKDYDKHFLAEFLPTALCQFKRLKMIPTTHRANQNHESDSSSRVPRTNTFYIEEPNVKTKLWYHWFNIRIRQYMILEVFFFISLFMIFYRLQTIYNQNDRVLEMVNSMKSQYGNMERKIELLVSRKPDQGISPFDNTEPLEQSIADVPQNLEIPTPTVPQMKQAMPKIEESSMNVSISKERFRFNAADYLKGADVDNDHSSRSRLIPRYEPGFGIVYDQTNLVLLDRPQPPADKAWCTNDENPVLTVNLAKYIKPVAVSYQHSKWNGKIPNGAPKTYDVMACLDCARDGWQPLALNCQYSQYETNGKEQMCNISSHFDLPLIQKVQFRFHENYGNSEWTCVHLVRVYGETTTPVKIEEKNRNSEQMCTDLTWYFHNNHFRYTWVNSMQSQYDNIEQKIELLVSRKLTPDISHLDNTEPLEQSVADILKNMKLSTLDSAVKSGLVVPEVNKSISQIEESNLKLPIHKERFRINAADYLKGASVDSARSSSSNLKPLIGYDQSNLVLLDRPEPPADRAWCTNDENPILTIKLAKYIKPISVSYQHSKWNGTIPNGAPKTYDVVACLDCADGEWEPLAMNCQYSHYESNVKEQMCNVSSNFDLPSIRKVQFRFRENYGNSEWTCVHLVRVYGETKTPVKIEEKNRNSEEICTDLTWYYHNNHFKYTWDISQLDNSKPLEKSSVDGLKNMKLPTQNSTDKMEPTVPQINQFVSQKSNQGMSQLEKSTVDGLKDIKLPTQDSADKTELRQEDTHKIEPAAPQTNRAISKTEDSTSEISESQFDNTKPLETSTVDGLKNMEVPTQDSKEKTEPIRDKKTELIQESTDEIETTAPQTNQAISKTEDSTSEISESKEQFLFNAADYLMGAHVDNYRSSSSNLNRGNGFGYDQTDLVLLDRPEPPADKAWCSNSENPVLTIKLAKYIKPISVSYEHSKWHGAIPNGAPKTYDVVACLDCNEEKWEPLALNCQYSQFESYGKEQMCNISSHFDLPLIREVQFRFRKNYGDTNRTCVNLVRVYGETDPPVIIEEKALSSGETCADLRRYYYNSYLKYVLDINQFDNTEPLEQSIADVLKNLEFPTQVSTENIEPTIPQMKQSMPKIEGFEFPTQDSQEKIEPIQDEKTDQIQEDTDEIEPTTPQNSAVSETEDSTSEVSGSEEKYRFNAADYLKGAYVDSARSSSSNLKPLIGYDQSNLVLLDRPQPPSDKAWCTNYENPVLTINLVEFIEPISVSYQHAKWNGTIPDGAPKTYDVVACFDYYCKTWKPLVSNCKYSQNKSNEKEQVCNIHLLNVPLIRTVQFRFRENYGDSKMTCVSLVRVYGETKTPAKIKEKNLDSEKLCAELKQYYHNSYFHKYFLMKKSCSVLYENDCCSECPECCQECLISDYNFGTLSSIFSHIILILIIFDASYVFDDISPDLIHGRNKLYTEESNVKPPLWYQWFNIQIRQLMILEIFFFISLTLIIYRLQTISNQNDLILEKVNSMQSELGYLERIVESLGKNTKFPKQDSTEKIVPTVLQKKKSKPKIISNERYRFNAADFLKGASVNMDYSSRSNLKPLIGYDQTNLVLLDRPQPPEDKAWCTFDKNPVLTINLAKYIKPIAVSYQHSEWHGTIPNEAPIRYDVVACLDIDCDEWEPLVVNCQYSENKSSETEQICNVPSHRNVSSVEKVQFRFRENYGGTRRTCVSLVRVYGETKTPAKIEKKSLESEEICADLTWYYHNSNFQYSWADKNCTVLYENNCCSECPECCEECLINDSNNIFLGNIFYVITCVIVWVLLGYCFAALRYYEHTRNAR